LELHPTVRISKLILIWDKQAIAMVTLKKG
jgi:hypothetical protein